MTAPTPTRSTARTTNARTSAAIAKIAAATGFSSAEVRGYLDRCVAVAGDAVAAGCDLETALEFVDRVPVPKPSSSRNSMPTPLHTSRPHNVLLGRPWLGAASPWAHRSAPTAGGHGLFLRHPGGPLQRVRADGRFETVSAHATAPAIDAASMVVAFRQALLDALGPLPTRHR